MRICKVVGLCVGIAALGGCADVEESRAREVVGAASDAVQPPIAGWASQTGYRQASTLVQMTIVAAAQASVGGSAGDSFSIAPIGNNTPWQTDIAGGDGARMRSAYKRYYDWRNNAAGQSFIQVRAKMIDDLATSAYDASRKGLLVDHIVAIAGPPAANGPFQPPPATDQDTLSSLGIRKQCLEWAVTTALQSGGKAKGYGASPVVSGGEDPRKSGEDPHQQRARIRPSTGSVLMARLAAERGRPVLPRPLRAWMRAPGKDTHRTQADVQPQRVHVGRSARTGAGGVGSERGGGILVGSGTAGEA